jgi:hypothetical protein
VIAVNIAALTRILVVFGALLFSTPTIAVAYGGPGSVISGIGAFLAVLAAVAAAILGFIWYPAKKLVRSVRGRLGGAGEGRGGASEDATA